MNPTGQPDQGDGVWTHVALQVSDAEASTAFYQRWANLVRLDTVQDAAGARAVRLGRDHLAFVLVLIQGPDPVCHPLDGFAHIGIECATRDEVDRLSADARRAGCLRHGPTDSGPPRGYWSLLVDPDGHQLELSYGQHNLGGAVGPSK